MKWTQEDEDLEDEWWAGRVFTTDPRMLKLREEWRLKKLAKEAELKRRAKALGIDYHRVCQVNFDYAPLLTKPRRGVVVGKIIQLLGRGK